MSINNRVHRLRDVSLAGDAKLDFEVFPDPVKKIRCGRFHAVFHFLLAGGTGGYNIVAESSKAELDCRIPNDGTLGRFRRSRKVEVWASGFHQGEVFVGDVFQFILVDFAFEDFFANLGNREDVPPGSKERTSTIEVGLIHT